MNNAQQHCIDCESLKPKVEGLLMCYVCFERYADKLRQKYGRSKKKKTEYEYWAEVAEKNGISRKVYSLRVHQLKMDYEKAATQPVRNVDRHRNRRIREALVKHGIEVTNSQIYYQIYYKKITDEKEIIKNLLNRHKKEGATNV